MLGFRSIEIEMIIVRFEVGSLYFLFLFFDSNCFLFFSGYFKIFFNKERFFYDFNFLKK